MAKLEIARKMENLHLIEFVTTKDGKDVTINRVVKDEDWDKVLNEVMREHDAVYVRANHHTKIGCGYYVWGNNGKAETRSGAWVTIKTKTKTSMKVGNIQDFGNGLARRVEFSSKELTDKMQRDLSFLQNDIARVSDTMIEIPYKWGVIGNADINELYQNARIFF